MSSSELASSSQQRPAQNFPESRDRIKRTQDENKRSFNWSCLKTLLYYHVAARTAFNTCEATLAGCNALTGNSDRKKAPRQHYYIRRFRKYSFSVLCHF
mgnify:CR=1 FL=1